MSFFSNPMKAIKSSLGGIGGGVIGNMIVPGIGGIVGGALGQGSQNAARGKSFGAGVLKGGLMGGGLPVTGSLLGGLLEKKRRPQNNESANKKFSLFRSTDKKPPAKSSDFLANEQLAEKLRNQIYRDQLALNSSNFPVYRGETSAPMSQLTEKARMLREEDRGKPLPYSKKIETLLKKEGTGFSPEQTSELLNILNKGNTQDRNQVLERLNKQFGNNYGLESERIARLEGKLAKDTARSDQSAAANFNKLNQEFADVENRRNMDVARAFNDAGQQKGMRRNALIEQLEDFGNQEHALRNLQNKAKRDAFDEEVSMPQRKIVSATRGLNNLGPEDDHPSKTAIRNKELQRIQNAYNAPYLNYPGQRVVGMQPESIEAMNNAGSINPKFRDAYYAQRKGIEKHAMNNSLPDQVFNNIPGALDPLLNNLDHLSRQQLKKESKSIAGKHVRLGSYGSGSHKAETERTLRDILNRVRQEREGALSGVAKGEASLATRKEQTGLTKHKMMDLLGSQQFGNTLDQNRHLNDLGWTKRSNRQAEENEALKNWYAQMQHSMGGTDITGYENLAKQYDTDLSSLFKRPQNYNENANAFNQYRNASRQQLTDPASRKQLEEWEEQQRRALMNGGYDPQYGYSPTNLKGQAYALARATPVY